MGRHTKEIEDLLHALIAEGCTIEGVDNGGGIVKTSILAEAVAEADCCDEAHVFLKCPDGKVRWMYLVLGNEPGVIASDYTVCDVFDRVTDSHYNKYNQ